MRRNVGGRVDVDGVLAPVAPGEGGFGGASRRGNSPPAPSHYSTNRHLAGHHFSRKHSVLLTLVFFFLVYAARTWRGALRDSGKPDLNNTLIKAGANVPPLPADEDKGKVDDKIVAHVVSGIWRGSHQSLSLSMDESASVIVCGEGQLFYVDSNAKGWPNGEFLDSIEEQGSGGDKDECCKVCTENENCNAFTVKAKICSLFTVDSGAASTDSQRSLAEPKITDEKEKDDLLISIPSLDDDDSIVPDLPEHDVKLEDRKPAGSEASERSDAAHDASNQANIEDDDSHVAAPLLIEHVEEDEVDDQDEDKASHPSLVTESAESLGFDGKEEDLGDPNEAVPLPAGTNVEGEENDDKHPLENDEHVKVELHPKAEVSRKEQMDDSAEPKDDPDLIPLSEVNDEDEESVSEPLSPNEEQNPSRVDVGDAEAEAPDSDDKATELEDLPSLQTNNEQKHSSLDDLLNDEVQNDIDTGSEPDASLEKSPSLALPDLPLEDDADENIDEPPVKQAVIPRKELVKTIPDLPLDDDDEDDEFFAPESKVSLDKRPDVAKSIPDLPADDDDDDDEAIPSSFSKPAVTKKQPPVATEAVDEDEEDAPIVAKPAGPKPKQKSVLDLELEGGDDVEDNAGSMSLDDLLSEVDDDDEEAVSSLISDLASVATQAAKAASSETSSKTAAGGGKASLTSQPVSTRQKEDSVSDDEMDEIFPQGNSLGEIPLSNEQNAKIANNPIRNILAPGFYGVTVLDPFYQQKSKYFGRFRAVSEIHDFLAEWQAEYSKPGPGRNWQVDLFTLGKSGEGKMIKAVEFGNPSRGKHVFVIGGLKGCDWVGPLAAVHSAVALVGRKRSTAHLLDAVRFHYIPLLNVDGYHYSRRKSPSSARHWCDNRRISGGGHGVNLERNWGEEDQSWGFGKKGKEGRKDKHGFQGLSGFSEPETKIVRDYIEHYAKGSGRVAVVQVRCCGGTITTPLLSGARAKDTAALSAISQGATLMASNIRSSGEGKDYPIIKPTEFTQEHTGQLVDWTASLGVDHSYALEIKALSVATYNDRYQINSEPFMALCKELEVGVVTAAQLLLQQPIQGPAPDQVFRPKASSSSSSSSTEKKSSSKTKKKSTSAR